MFLCLFRNFCIEAMRRRNDVSFSFFAFVYVVYDLKFVCDLCVVLKFNLLFFVVFIVVFFDVDLFLFIAFSFVVFVRGD